VQESPAGPVIPATPAIPESPATPDNQNEITIPAAPTAPAAQENQNEITIPVTPESQATPDNSEEVIIIDDSGKKGEDEEIEIIIEDEKPSTDALEDEYYELDGF
jgi:hypothetical protein